jgi:hypothetical protein
MATLQIHDVAGRLPAWRGHNFGSNDNALGWDAPRHDSANMAR